MNLNLFSNFICIIGFLSLFSEVSTNVIYISIVSFLLQFFKKLPKTIISIVKVFLIGLTIYLMWKKFHSFLVTEVGISFMLVMSFLKLSELESNDDFFNMFLILILLEGCIFISNPSLLIFIVGLVKILLYFYFLIKLQKYNLNLLSLRRVLMLALPAIIFAIGLYFTFPRFTQGFIGFNTRDFFNTTGNTNINFGDLREFVPSDKNVFKIYNFNSSNTSNLYWKTNHLWDFRNNQWRLSNVVFKEKTKPQDFLSKKSSYTLKTEAIYVDYIPHLDGKTEIKPLKQEITYYADNIFKLKPPSKGPHLFEMYSLSKLPTASTLEIEKGLKVPELIKNKYNPLIFKDEKKNLTAAERLNKVLTFFMNKKYQYSLTPRSYKTIEEFLDNGIDGYCSHFASAFALLLRVADIPSRVVIGYQGGNLNQFDGSILIKEKDSHAWVEYLNDDKQWTRIDPTEMVIPERIRLGGDDFFNSLSRNSNLMSQLVSVLATNQFIDQAQDFINYLESVSSSSLFSIDQLEQKKLMKNKAGIIFSIVLILFVVFFYFFSKHVSLTQKNPDEVRYLDFLSKMKKHGYIKNENETALEFMSRIKTANHDLNDYAIIETNKYISSIYDRKK